MADTRTPEQRRRIMQSVRTANTGPELIVRKILHRLGFRYRLHAPELPGRVDVYLPKYRKAIFVHGCFWHGHRCEKGRLPRSRLEYWGPKIEANKQRDRANRQALKALGIEPLVVWQCQTKDCTKLATVLVLFLRGCRSNRGKKTST